MANVRFNENLTDKYNDNFHYTSSEFNGNPYNRSSISSVMRSCSTPEVVKLKRLLEELNTKYHLEKMEHNNLQTNFEKLQDKYKLNCEAKRKEWKEMERILYPRISKNIEAKYNGKKIILETLYAMLCEEYSKHQVLDEKFTNDWDSLISKL